MNRPWSILSVRSCIQATTGMNKLTWYISVNNGVTKLLNGLSVVAGTKNGSTPALAAEEDEEEEAGPSRKEITFDDDEVVVLFVDMVKIKNIIVGNLGVIVTRVVFFFSPSKFLLSPKNLMIL